MVSISILNAICRFLSPNRHPPPARHIGILSNSNSLLQRVSTHPHTRTHPACMAHALIRSHPETVFCERGRGNGLEAIHTIWLSQPQNHACRLTSQAHTRKKRVQWTWSAPAGNTHHKPRDNPYLWRPEWLYGCDGNVCDIRSFVLQHYVWCCAGKVSTEAFFVGRKSQYTHPRHFTMYFRECSRLTRCAACHWLVTVQRWSIRANRFYFSLLRLRGETENACFARHFREILIYSDWFFFQ